MGYRHYFYLIEKKEVENICNMTYNELIDYVEKQGWEIEDSWFSITDAFNQKEIFEFGKLYWDDTADLIYKTGVPLFKNKETQKKFSDYIPYVVGKPGLEKAIEIYKNKILNYFKSLVSPECISENLLEFSIEPKDLNVADICLCLKDKILKWSNIFGLLPINMNEDKEEISNSWLFEYQIFELVRLYKSIDWDKYTILFYGH